MEIDVNLQASHELRFGIQRLVLLANAFNLFNTQRVRVYDDWTEITFETPNPNFGHVARYQAPGALQFSVRLEF